MIKRSVRMRERGSPRVESTDIYDLASLSKTTGTLLAIMKLYDKGRFSLTDKISDYLPFLGSLLNAVQCNGVNLFQKNGRKTMLLRDEM